MPGNAKNLCMTKEAALRVTVIVSNENAIGMARVLYHESVWCGSLVAILKSAATT